MHRSSLLAVFTALWMAGVATAQPVAIGPAPPAVQTGTGAEYRLGSGDKIRVIVYTEPNLSGEFIVGPSGDVSLPLIGVIDAMNKSVGDIQGVIETKLKNGYLKDPRVSIEVLTYRPFYILGEVNHPGEYPYTAGLTITRAVATAQGYTYRANTKRVFIKHQGQSTEVRVPSEGAVMVLPGDIIRVPERLF